jgi:fluoride exporter
MLNVAWFFAGGGLANLARQSASGFVSRYWGDTFPVGTAVVNDTGALLSGLFAALTSPLSPWLMPASFRQFRIFGTGGDDATLSSFILQTLTVFVDGGADQPLSARARCKDARRAGDAGKGHGNSLPLK